MQTQSSDFPRWSCCSNPYTPYEIEKGVITLPRVSASTASSIDTPDISKITPSEEVKYTLLCGDMRSALFPSCTDEGLLIPDAFDCDLSKAFKKKLQFSAIQKLQIIYPIFQKLKGMHQQQLVHVEVIENLITWQKDKDQNLATAFSQFSI